MSAIAGMVRRDGGPCDRADIRGALGILVPLGRDGCGEWHGRVAGMGAALGVRLRRRVPEDDADAQPVLLDDGHIAVVADVVLSNRAELCCQLELRDTAELSDSAIVAHAYWRWGERFAERLRGGFAIAVADRRRGGVLLARDHIGTRPLHLYQGPSRVAFASTALGVTGFAGVPAEPDLVHVAQFVTPLLDADRSWIRGVVPVAPGSTVWIGPRGVRQRRYWRLSHRARWRGSAEHHADELRFALDAAVRAGSRRRGALGVMLSGGLDSTAVGARLAEQVAPETVHSYTSVPPPGWSGHTHDRDPDESPLVRLLAQRHPNLRPQFVDAVGADAIHGDDAYFTDGGTPIRNTLNMTWIAEVHRRASADGVSALFTGAMGNLSLSRDDPRWLVDLLAAGRIREAWREARAWSAAYDRTMGATVVRSVLAPMAPARVRRWMADRRGMPRLWELWRATPLRGGLPEPGRLRRLASGDPLDRGAARNMIVEGLAVHAAHADARAVYEARSGWREIDPTADVAVLELAARQPSWACRHRGYGRAAARACGRRRVPDEIRLRRTRGIQLPDWYDRLTDARAELGEEIARARSHPLSAELLDVGWLDRLVRDWPRPEDVRTPAATVLYLQVLPRALAVSRYLRWLSHWNAGGPRPSGLVAAHARRDSTTGSRT
jgi:asparagine synthase (glutamine-hydrolysing)